jgi:hypothetical protein
MCGAYRPRKAEPATAANYDAKFAAIRAPGGTIGGRSRVALMEAVIHPFTHISEHVMQAESIRQEAGHWGRKDDSVVAVERREVRLVLRPRMHLSQAVVRYVRKPTRIVDIVAPRSGGRSAGACGVLPLCLIGQPVAVSRLLGQPLNVSLCIGEIYADDRVIVSLRKARITP